MFLNGNKLTYRHSWLVLVFMWLGGNCKQNLCKQCGLSFSIIFCFCACVLYLSLRLLLEFSNFSGYIKINDSRKPQTLLLSSVGFSLHNSACSGGSGWGLFDCSRYREPVIIHQQESAMHFKGLMTIVQSLDSDTDGRKQRRSPNRSLARLQTYQVKYFVLRSSDFALQLTNQLFKHTACSFILIWKHPSAISIVQSVSRLFTSFRSVSNYYREHWCFKC